MSEQPTCAAAYIHALAHLSCHCCWLMSAPVPVPTFADGTAQGVLLLNSNGMDILLNKTSVTFRYGP